MLPWIKLDAVEAPELGGLKGAQLQLKQRGTEFAIMIGPINLMTSRLSGSEEALANLVFERLSGVTSPHVLIGGLGMGFTLRAALAAAGPDARIVVAELVPAVVAWARGPMAELFADCLDDPRVTIHVGDVAELIAQGKTAQGKTARFDAILLDVDNGPEGLTQASNDWLYSHQGLHVARVALRSGGILAVWSSSPDAAFSRRLNDTNFKVEEVKVSAGKSTKGPKHVIWLARKP
jgi:spermidine synthase